MLRLAMLKHFFCPDWATWLFQGIPGLFWESLCEEHQAEGTCLHPQTPKTKENSSLEIPSTSDSSPMLAALGLDKYDA
jgi:hypothetical protein